MANDALFASIPSLVYLGVEIVLVSFLLVRAWQRRSANLFILAATFVTDAAALVLNMVQFQLASNIPDMLEPYLGALSFGMRGLGAIFITIFTARTFYQRQASPYRVFVTITTLTTAGLVCINIVHASISIMDELVLHFINMPGIFTAILMGHAWLARAARSMVTVLCKDEMIEPWIVTRYKLIALFSILPIFTAIPPIFLIPDLYTSSIATIMYMIMGILQGLFVIGSAICWMVPRAVKDRWNKGYARPPPSILDATSNPFTIPQMIYLIEHLGELLSSRVKKTAAACKGLIFLSIQEEFGEGALSQLNLANLVQVIQGNVRRQLAMLNVMDASEIVQELEIEMIRLQSIMTVGNV